MTVPKVLLYMLLISAHTVMAQNPPTGYEPASIDSYGLGVRIGVYCQATAYLLGFLNLLRVDVRGQLTGIILGFQLLIRWSDRMWQKELSPPEAWVILALALTFTTPGIWLLTLVFHTQRERLRISRREVVRGQGFNIILTVTTTVAVMVADFWFSFFLSQSGSFPSVGDNMIWFFKARPVHSPLIRGMLIAQACVTLLNAGPAGLYFYAWVRSAKAWFSPKAVQAAGPLSEEDRMNFLESLLGWKRIGLSTLVVFSIYSVLAALSIELTIKAAGLKPQNDIDSPGQLIPFLTGCFALISAVGEIFRKRSANDFVAWENPTSSVGDRRSLLRESRNSSRNALSGQYEMLPRMEYAYRGHY